MLAAYGSGAARVSSDESKRILNVDIGGGTTKLGLVENGRVIATAAVHIGGGRDYSAVFDQAELGGAAADVDVKDAF